MSLFLVGVGLGILIGIVIGITIIEREIAKRPRLGSGNPRRGG